MSLTHCRVQNARNKDQALLTGEIIAINIFTHYIQRVKTLMLTFMRGGLSGGETQIVLSNPFSTSSRGHINIILLAWIPPSLRNYDSLILGLFASQ